MGDFSGLRSGPGCGPEVDLNGTRSLLTLT